MYQSAKNFKYGELYETDPGELLTKQGTGRQLVNPETLTRNRVFLEFLREESYRVFLDFEMSGTAHTNVTRREIVLNGNYANYTLSCLLHHEMGHLTLFNVNQFTTVAPNTLRSLITQVIYTPQNLIDYGISQLLTVENIIQDIIIETLSDGRCVCNAITADCGKPAGVKHLDYLQSLGFIAWEACKTVLRKLEKDRSDKLVLTREQAEQIRDALESMLEDLRHDRSETSARLKEVAASDQFADAARRRTEHEAQRLESQLKKVNDYLKKAEKLGKDPAQKVTDLQQNIQKQLQDLQSAERARQDAADAATDRQKAMDNLQRSLDRLTEIENELQKQLTELLENLRNASNGASCSEPGGSTLDGSDFIGHSGESPEGAAEPDGSKHHSFNCGYPIPRTVSRSGSDRNARLLTSIGSVARARSQSPLEIDLDLAIDRNARNKSTEKEFTYFKPNKKEIDATDMMRGKRRLRVSGVNVLVGLDVSGSMTHEWTSLFGEIVSKIEDLKDHLDIEQVVYFTYNHELQQQATEISDLQISAGGGNAFAYVYQQICQEVPLFSKNEIILITDCGDNLGFNLDSVCKVTRNNFPVKTHITVCDTEGAGFYVKTNFDERYWDLRHIGDLDLFDRIQDNLNNLITAA